MSFLEKKEANHARGMSFPTAGPSWEATRAGPGRVMLQQDARRGGFIPIPASTWGGDRAGPIALGHWERRALRGKEVAEGHKATSSFHGAEAAPFLRRASVSPSRPPCPCPGRTLLIQDFLLHMAFLRFTASHSRRWPAAQGGRHQHGGPLPQKKTPLHPLGPRIPLGSPKKTGCSRTGCVWGGSQGFGGGM